MSAYNFFPSIETADADGLLMLGGQLSTRWLLAAYRQGIFPWPFDDDDTAPVAWWCPDPRAVIELENFHVSRRLAEKIRQQKFRVTFNTSFPQVVFGCAAPRKGNDGTWITASLAAAFCRLHQLGLAHSVETWVDNELVGGVYGVAIGGYFSAESMFHTATDASKIALVHLVNHLQTRGYTLLDIQQRTPHTTRLGATDISRGEFCQRLRNAIQLPITFL